MEYAVEDRLYFLGEHVHAAAKALAAPPPPHEGRVMRWAPSDHNAFDATIRLDDYLTRYGLEMLPYAPRRNEVVPYAGRLALAEPVAAFRRALPYSAAELGLMGEVEAVRDPYAKGVARVIRREIRLTEVTDAGVRRVVAASELMQRFWKWRRGIGELADENGPARAVVALEQLNEGIENHPFYVRVDS